MVRLDNDGFLMELMSLLKKTRTAGGVQVTMKRTSDKVRHSDTYFT